MTHPVMGLPSKKTWLPSVKEVFDACSELHAAVKRREAREQRIQEQLAAVEEEDRLSQQKPTLAELQAKYGKNWGLDSTESAKNASTFRAPSWDSIAEMYKAEPGRITRLADALPRLRMENTTAE